MRQLSKFLVLRFIAGWRSLLLLLLLLLQPLLLLLV
jgi:hypothetical protein